MRFAFVALAVLLCLSAPALTAARVAPNAHSLPPLTTVRAPFVPGEVLVLASRGGALAATRAGGSPHSQAEPLAATLTRLGIDRVEPIGPAATQEPRRYDALRLVSGRADFDPYAAARELVVSGAAIAASPNLRLQLHAVPNDPYLANQWHLSTSAAGVRARQGWDHSTGSSSVVIGIMDTGVDRQHNDLFFKINTNTREIANNYVDDDHNGWVDDVQGWDFGDGDNIPDPQLTPDVYGLDTGWHGTFVAGLAAAATNNSNGIAGVAWGCRVLPLKVSDAYGDIMLSSVVDAFHYAQAARVSVLNISLGTSDPSAAGFFQELVNAANDAGIVVVASAGNDGVDTPSYPAACDRVLAVGATTASNNRASWSNWGDWVTLLRPAKESGRASRATTDTTT